jgi:hypothetical protein
MIKHIFKPGLPHLFLFAAVSAFSIVAAPVGATVLTASSDTLSFSWDYHTSADTHLTGTGQMVVSGFGSTELTINTTLTNTSQATGQGGERLTAFAFGIEPNATAVDFSDADDAGIVDAGFASGTLPANVTGVEVCGFGGQNCAGGSNEGIYAGLTDEFDVILTGTWGDQVEIDPIGLRYQTGYGSFTFGQTDPGPGPGPGPEPGPVPVPAPLALFGLGGLMLGWTMKRKQRT